MSSLSELVAAFASEWCRQAWGRVLHRSHFGANRRRFRRKAL